MCQENVSASCGNRVLVGDGEDERNGDTAAFE
jgi:hypothetical protein